jgi:hypothetical protein
MSTSLRIDTAEPIPGALLIGDVGLGVQGSAIPSSGTHGPAFAYDSVVLQAGYGAQEYRGTLTSVPSGVTIVAAEDTSFTATGPAGSHTIAWSLFKDGALVGHSTFIVSFGA